MRRGFQLNLVSLADIVSNAIGMLVLFVLITVLHSRSNNPMPDQPPIEFKTKRRALFFLCQGDSIVYLDPLLLGATLLPAVDTLTAQHGASLPASQFPPIEVSKLGLSIHFDTAFRMVLTPLNTTAWEPLGALDNPKSRVRQVLDHIEPAHQYAFFFVNDAPTAHSPSASGFAMLERARTLLNARGIATGWIPYDESHLPVVCEDEDEGACRHLPSQGPRRSEEGSHGQ